MSGILGNFYANTEKFKCICQPLGSWNDILSWTPSGDDANTSPPLKEKDAIPLENRPRMMVCHDMAGGYLEDRFTHGVSSKETYNFYHWQHVDVFIYFSHHFITIPPPCWTSTAHRHGTRILGTLITEWKDGKARCDKLLECKDNWEFVADQLVKIMTYYGFDGWLINIENPVQEGQQIQHLKEFISLLCDKTHKENPGGLIIWYDSVTHNGDLKWQDALNDLNCDFFDICDGIFLNYCWNEDKLAESRKRASNKERQYDVYVGVDVFGRGCLGDGGFNTLQAVQAAADHQLSVALFAPGWVYQKLDKEHFISNQNKFWSLFSHICPQRHHTTLPFGSHFCQGRGNRFYENGKVLRNEPWSNLALQSKQLSFSHCLTGAVQGSKGHTVNQIETDQTSNIPHSAGDISFNWQDAYHGGCSLLLSSPAGECNTTTFSLLSCGWSFNEPLFVSYTTKEVNDCKSLRTCLILQIKVDGETKTMILGDKTKDYPNSQHITEFGEAENRELLGKLFAKPNDGWIVRKFEIPDNLFRNGNRIIEQVNLEITRTQPPTIEERLEILLGQIQVTPSSELRRSTPAVRNLSVQTCVTDTDDQKALLDITWDFPSELADYFLVFYRRERRQCEKDTAAAERGWTLLGMSHTNCYGSGCIDAKDGDIHVLVQPFLSSGFLVPLALCTSL